MSGGKKKVPDTSTLSDEELDRLVLQASSEYILNPDQHDDNATPLDPGEPEEFWLKRRFWRIAGITASILVVLAVVSWIAAAWLKSRRIDKLVEDTSAEVTRLTSAASFEQAMNFIQDQQAAGLPPEAYRAQREQILASYESTTVANVEAKIKEGRLALAEAEIAAAAQQWLKQAQADRLKQLVIDTGIAKHHEILQRADEAIKNRSVEEARSLVADAEDLSRFADGTHLARVRTALMDLEADQRFEPARKLIDKSRKAAGDKQWDEALRLVEQARGMPVPADELNAWENGLRSLVGGRVRIAGSPPHLKARVADRHNAGIGDVVSGLAQGPVRVVLEADGYVPEIAHATVHYPDVTELSVDLMAQCPNAIWAIQLLSNQCAQELALAVYLRDDSLAEHHAVLGALTRPCQPSRQPATLVGEELTQAVREAIKAFTDSGDDPVPGLLELGDFTKQHAAALKLVLADDGCLAGIKKALSRIEAGCRPCMANKRIVCQDCRGRGKRKEMRRCRLCDGTGQKTCSPCKGDGKIRCKKCKGKGRISKRVKDHEKNEWVDKLVGCRSCKASGKRDCSNCNRGKRSCVKCDGTGQRKRTGSCSTCAGAGGIACATCGGTGERVQMEIQARREAEMAAREAAGIGN